MLTGVLQPGHLLLILVVALLFLGPKRLPGAGRALGQGLKEFKSSLSGEHADALPRPGSEVTGHEQDSSQGAE
ncbi:MAG: sec-independent protein translocase protein TatA [Solirubrobacteraceae bacterium]|jgi:sec-independent protein translocase protein TatA|nr:sec-independent protein translocase protein TatA [Solirubrobacteraceae bacterium]